MGKFSGGMRRRLSVAISFMGNPSVVYLDEPSSVRAWPKAAARRVAHKLVALDKAERGPWLCKAVLSKEQNAGPWAWQEST